jgi:hypothetical protein
MQQDRNGISEKLQEQRCISNYARDARMNVSNTYYSGTSENRGRELEEGGNVGEIRVHMSLPLQQQLSYKWPTFVHDCELELEYQFHHSRAWLPKVRAFGIGTTIVCLLFAVLYWSENFGREGIRLWNIPLMLMVFGAAIPSMIVHLRDERDFVSADDGLDCTKKPMPSSVCGRLLKCDVPLLNRCGLKRCQTEQRLQYLVSTAFAFVASNHAIRAALDPRAPIHYAFSLAYSHPFYVALFGASGFLTFPFYVLTAAIFTIFHALSFYAYLIRDAYLANFGTERRTCIRTSPSAKSTASGCQVTSNVILSRRLRCSPN